MKKFWMGLAIGALAGGLAAVLYAPQSGASTRRKVRRSVEDLGDSLSDAADYLKEQAERLSKEAQKLVEGRGSQAADVLSAARDYVQTASGKVSRQATRLM